jgi:hypothetical protein
MRPKNGKRRGGGSEETERWNRLWADICELSNTYETRLIFIGGIAVYLHLRASQPEEDFAEFSHDGDFLISLTDAGVMRDFENLVRNPRLRKHEIKGREFDFDVYVEHDNNLAVSFVDAMEASEVIEGVRVAALEHLLVLKLHAYAERRGSPKGDKDERDIIRILYVMHDLELDMSLLAPYWSKSMSDLLESVKRSKQFVVMTHKNDYKARVLREDFEEVCNQIVEELRTVQRDRGGRRRRRI